MSKKAELCIDADSEKEGIPIKEQIKRLEEMIDEKNRQITLLMKMVEEDR